MSITDAVLKSISSPESYARGFKLFQAGAVYDTFRNEKVITGKCDGSSAPFYKVRVKIDEGWIQESSCTCSYDWGGACKHIIALVLTYIHSPDAFNAEDFIHRFLQHVLPKGFVKVRYFGFFSARSRKWLERIKQLIGPDPETTSPEEQRPEKAKPQPVHRCPV